MTVFQTVLLVIAGCVLAGSLIAMLKGWATRREGVVLSLIATAASVAIVWPAVTTSLARAMGIGRGTDLVLYCAVVVMFVGFVMTYARIRHLRREITLLVRAIALRDATEGSETERSSA